MKKVIFLIMIVCTVVMSVSCKSGEKAEKPEVANAEKTVQEAVASENKAAGEPAEEENKSVPEMEKADKKTLQEPEKTENKAAAETKQEVKAEKQAAMGKAVKNEPDTEKQTEEKPAAAQNAQPEAPKPSEPEKPKAVQDNAVDLASVRSAIINSLGIEDAMTVETPALMNLYGIDSGMVKQSASFVTVSGTFPHEIIMIEAADASSASEIHSALQNRLNEVLVQSQSYDAENYAVAQQCKVIQNGMFVSLFLSPNHAAIQSVYSQYIK